MRGSQPSLAAPLPNSSTSDLQQYEVPRTKLLKCLVYDLDIVLVNDNLPIRMNRNKSSSVLRLQAFYETIIQLFIAWQIHRQPFRPFVSSKRSIPETVSHHHIGVEAFRLLMNDQRFWGIPMCLETPKGPDLKEDIENLSLLRSLIEG